MNQKELGCAALIIRARRAARSTLRELDDIYDERRKLRRTARQCRESGNPVLIRRAQVIDARLQEYNPDIEIRSDVLVFIGESIRLRADEIDAELTTRELCDLLEVNPVDRARVGESAGIVDIAFIHGLEDSATYRGLDFKEGPLAKAIIRYMAHAMETNPELQARITKGLFGKGGMCEFMPTYKLDSGGNMVRQPPKLRLADECDFTSKGV